MMNQEILAQVRRIELSSRRLMDSALAGAYHSRFKGKGMEFAEVREYIPGDEIRSIDWNVTARSSQPHVKQFDEERELSLMLVVDCSASTLFGSGNYLKRESMAMVAAVLAFAAVKNQDQVGLLLFSDHLEKVIPPAKGRKHVLRLIRDLLEFEPQGKGTRFESAIEGLRKNLKKRSVVCVLSDFLQFGSLDEMKLLRRMHEVLAFEFKDPFEGNIPALGKLPVEDLETGEIHWLNTMSSRFRKKLKESDALVEDSLAKDFLKMGVDHLQILQKDTFAETLDPVVKYFAQRGARSKKSIGGRR